MRRLLRAPLLKRRFSSLGRQLLDFLNPQPQLTTENIALWTVRKSTTSGDIGRIPEWLCVTDVDYGGKSKCEVVEHHEEGSVGGFMRVSGQVCFIRTENTKAKGGFCAIQGKCSSTVDLRDYSGLVLTLRSCTRKQAFTFNLKPNSLFEGDIYQVKCEIEPSGQQWKSINIPFSRFHLTAQGVEREYQRSNDSLRVELLGFLFTGDGDFELDIKDIVAIP